MEKWRKRAAKEPVKSEAEIRAGALEDIRGFIRKAAEIKDPREMWFALRDVLNLLAMLLVPEPDVILPQDVPGPTTP